MECQAESAIEGKGNLRGEGINLLLGVRTQVIANSLKSGHKISVSRRMRN